MSDNVIGALVTIGTAIVGIAILAVLVSKQANTAGVISAGGSAFAQDISAAVSPITGGQSGFGLSSFSGQGAPILSGNY